MDRAHTTTIGGTMRHHLFSILLLAAMVSGCPKDCCCDDSSDDKKSSTTKEERSGGCNDNTSSSSQSSTSSGCGGYASEDPHRYPDYRVVDAAHSCVRDSDCTSYGHREVCCKRGGYESVCVAAEICQRRAQQGESCVGASHPWPLQAPYPCEPELLCAGGICQCRPSACERPCGPLGADCRYAECCSSAQVCQPPPGAETCVDAFSSIAIATHTAANERSPTLDKEAKVLVFSRDGADGGDLWSSREVGGAWLRPRRLELLNSPAAELSPTLGPDGLELYFSSARASGGCRSGLNIWRSVRPTAGHDWSVPEPVPSLSSGCDDRLKLTPDGKRAALLRTCGGAAAEIYVVHRQGSGWGAPLPLDTWLTTTNIADLWLSSDLLEVIVARRIDAGLRLQRHERSNTGARFGAAKELLPRLTRPHSDLWARIRGGHLELVFAELEPTGGLKGAPQWRLVSRTLAKP